MTRARFGLLLALLAVLAAAAAFAAGMAVLDDGEPDAPPRPGTDAGDPLGDAAPPASTTTTPMSPDAPAWVVVIASEADEAGAAAFAEQVAGAGHPTGVLRSDDYSSLNPGFWVAYAGPYPDRPAAEAAVVDLADAGFDDTYARCAGTQEACGARR